VLILERSPNGFADPLRRRAGDLLARQFLQSKSRPVAKRQTFVAVSQLGEWRYAAGWQRDAFDTWSGERPAAH